MIRAMPIHTEDKGDIKQIERRERGERE